MRRLHRPNVQLPTLTAPGKGFAQAAKHVAARQADPAAELRFAGHWNEPDVRGALLAMQGWVCAYCQRRPSNRRGEVDHFRPKAGNGTEHSGYWWLAYAFENHLLACHDCNHRKGSRFPLEEGAICADYAMRMLLPDEARLFISPCDDAVEEWMRVDWMPGSEEGWLKARLALAEGSRAQLRTSRTLHDFRLNTDLEIRRPRLLALREAARAHRAGDREAVRRLACRYLPHGAAVHNFIEDVEPSWLPTPKEELFILLEELLQELRELSSDPRGTEAPENESTIQEIFWAFAVLWKAPPPGTMTPEEIAQWLDAQSPGFKRTVEERYVRLSLRVVPQPTALTDSHSSTA
ncbi:MAG TPA: hypothetical protein VNA24_00600 [Hyalangium sp.]|jgi:uncharacterized protein (TIGR02646 family)|nr:hypothetical protein [Hyalangium sp.]